MTLSTFTPLLTTGEAAKRLGLSPRTLETLRVRGGGPVFVKMGKAVRYEAWAIEAWIDARRTASTSEYNG
jgi:excisionase family DNA binding protein